jgi:hypothetical protein
MAKNTKSEAQPSPRRIRLPGFVVDEDVGLGDVIKRATAAIGIKPCGGCERRATQLNRWIVFSSDPNDDVKE